MRTVKIDRASANGALYGLLLGSAFFILDVLGSATLWALFWAVQTALLATAAWLTWRRTKLAWMTAGMAYAAVVAAALTVLSGAGLTLRTISVRWPAVFIVAAAMTPASLLLSRWREAEGWKEWRDRTAAVTFRDMLRFRHIPKLTSKRA